MKDEAIKEALEERKKEHEMNFKYHVRSLVYKIEQKSFELRQLKRQLVDLEYTELEFDEDLG